MLVVGRLRRSVDARWLVLVGLGFGAFGSWGMTYYSLDVTQMNIIWPAFMQGIGLGLVFVPLSTVAYATLPRERMAEAAGLYSLVRTIGSAVGISIVTTLLAHQSQILWNELGVYVSQYHEALLDYMRRMHLSPTDPRGLAVVGGGGPAGADGRDAGRVQGHHLRLRFHGAAGVPAEAQHHAARRPALASAEH